MTIHTPAACSWLPLDNNIELCLRYRSRVNEVWSLQMEYRQIFKEPHLVGLWLSQVLSSIGDQLYSIAIIWIAVETGGAAAGFVTAAGTLSGLLLGVLGGVYADRWNKRTSMIAVDVLRALTVVSLGLIGHFTPLTLWHLGIASIIVNGLGALFDPALAACLPELTGASEKRLQAMNALMQVNHRFARTIGPGLAGWLVAMTALHHFFTLDAITFFVSAAAIYSIRGNYKWRSEPTIHSKSGISGVWAEICRGAKLVYEHEQLFWAFAMYVVANIAWSAAFMVGLPLWAKALPHADVGTYGIIVASYGVGSVSSNIVMGTLSSRRRMFFISFSQLFFAAGFMLIAMSNNLPMACFGAMLAAVGGPAGDVMMMVMLQTDIPRQDLGKVFSLRQCVMYGGASVGLIIAPLLYELCTPQVGLSVSAITFMLLGIVGLMKFGLAEAPDRQALTVTTLDSSSEPASLAQT